VRWRLGVGGALGLILAAVAAGTAIGAVQVVDLSAQRVVPGTVVTLRVATTASALFQGTGAVFMIPTGTFGDSRESLRCEQVGRAIQVGQIQWLPGTVEYEGVTYDGVTGEATFTVPQVAVDRYSLTTSIDTRGTGCHIFTSIEVVASLPDTAQPIVGAATGLPHAYALGIGLLGLSLILARRRTGAAPQACPCQRGPPPGSSA
jgi:hypothetical protein